jgi:hypothetical protein
MVTEGSTETKEGSTETMSETEEVFGQDDDTAMKESTGPDTGEERDGYVDD